MYDDLSSGFRRRLSTLNLRYLCAIGVASKLTLICSSCVDNRRSRFTAHARRLLGSTSGNTNVFDCNKIQPLLIKWSLICCATDDCNNLTDFQRYGWNAATNQIGTPSQEYSWESTVRPTWEKVALSFSFNFAYSAWSYSRTCQLRVTMTVRYLPETSFRWFLSRSHDDIIN